jgi:hypothetical protein
MYCAIIIWSLAGSENRPGVCDSEKPSPKRNRSELLVEKNEKNCQKSKKFIIYLLHINELYSII